MKTHALRFPVLADNRDHAQDPSSSLVLSNLLPGVKAGLDTASGDVILLEAPSMAARSTAAPFTTEGVPFTRTKRLVVLIPENELDENELARRLWRMAAPGALQVFLLSLSPEPGSEAYLRMRLATLASRVRDERVEAGFAFVSGHNWLEALLPVWQPGDLLVCLEDGRPARWFFPGADLGRRLSEALEAPVYILNGLKMGPSLRQLRRRKEWLAWAGFLGTLAAFSWVQLLVTRTMTGNLWTFFMVLSVLAELYVLWEINQHTQ